MLKDYETRIRRAVLILFFLQILVGLGAMNPELFWFKTDKIPLKISTTAPAP